MGKLCIGKCHMWKWIFLVLKQLIKITFENVTIWLKSQCNTWVYVQNILVLCSLQKSKIHDNFSNMHENIFLKIVRNSWWFLYIQAREYNKKNLPFFLKHVIHSYKICN